MSDISEEAKNQFLNNVHNECFNHNFGRMNKSDYDLMIFKYYFSIVKGSQDGSDYEISKQLGISEQRVKTFKQKLYLNGGYTVNWQESFIQALQSSAHYDNQTCAINVVLDDINVLNEVMHALITIGWYAERTLTANLVKIPVLGACELVAQINGNARASEQDIKNLINRLQEVHELPEDRENQIVDSLQYSGKEFANSLIKAGGRVILRLIASRIPGLNILLTLFS